ncbi:hypothetical protein, partial [Neisseria sicca]|uniref:hypothetical protein n=1 Tax=Neisseria sicca TaxID=490 RepID=UPI001C99BC73
LGVGERCDRVLLVNDNRDGEEFGRQGGGKGKEGGERDEGLEGVFGDNGVGLGEGFIESKGEDEVGFDGVGGERFNGEGLEEDVGLGEGGVLDGGGLKVWMEVWGKNGFECGMEGGGLLGVV